MRREEILAVLEAHRSELDERGVSSLRLFGSVARGEDSEESDVDLLVDFAESPSFSEFMRLRFFLEELLDAKVDLVTERGLKDRVRPYVAYSAEVEQSFRRR